MWKINKIVATRCHILRLKCTKFNFGWGSAPDPAGWGYSTLPDPLADFKGPTSKEREGRVGQGGEGKGREGTPWFLLTPPWREILDKTLDIAIKPFSKWRPSAILNFRNFAFWSRDLYLTWSCFFVPNFALIVEIYPKKWFLIWRLAAILDLQNFDILRRGCYWNQNLHLHTKLRWNLADSRWDIAKKTRPCAILNFRNLVFWSYDLC